MNSLWDKKRMKWSCTDLHMTKGTLLRLIKGSVLQNERGFKLLFWAGSFSFILVPLFEKMIIAFRYQALWLNLAEMYILQGPKCLITLLIKNWILVILISKLLKVRQHFCIYWLRYANSSYQNSKLKIWQRLRSDHS